MHLEGVGTVFRIAAEGAGIFEKRSILNTHKMEWKESGELIFADKTFADGHFSTSYNNKNLKSPWDREEGPVGP